MGTFTIGKATTYLNGPLEADGYIDYSAALNERLSRGITTENNAVTWLWKALGPCPERVTIQPKFFESLGIQLREHGDYFVALGRYLQNELETSPDVIFLSEKKSKLLCQKTWTAEEHPEISSWLKANGRPLDLVVEATKLRQYYSPINGRKGLIDSSLPTAYFSRPLAPVLTSRAMQHLGAHNYDAAWQDLLSCHRLGRLIGSGATEIEALECRTTEIIACNGELAFLEKIQHDTQRLEACSLDLQRLPPLPDLAEKVNVFDRYAILDTIMQVDRHGWEFLNDSWLIQGNPFGDMNLDGIDWNPALEKTNHWFDRVVEILRDKNRGDRARKLEQFRSDLQELRTIVADPDRHSELVRSGKDPAKARDEVVGDILISLLFPAISKVQEAMDRVTQTFDNVITAFALARYKCDEGKYPDRLEKLVPRYLAQVPKDLFTGGALIYKPSLNGYLFYNVGLNRRDDGGRSYYDQPPGDDIAVQMPLPPPKEPPLFFPKR